MQPIKATLRQLPLQLAVSQTSHGNEPEVTQTFTIDFGQHRAAWVLWFAVPQDQANAITWSPEAALVCLIQPLMRLGQPVHLHVEGHLSPSLHWHLQEFMAMWCHWHAASHPVTLTADQYTEVPASAQPNLGVASFSGGSDSCHTAWTLHQGAKTEKAQPCQLGALLMVHGMDIPYTDTQAFATAYANAQQQVASLPSVPLYRLRTNLRDFHDPHIHWEQSFGSAVAGCLRLFAGQYGQGIIPSSMYYGALLLPHGSNPITDPLLSSQHFAVHVHGSALTRGQKLKALLDWPQGLAGLRVCWQLHAQGKNCGVCRKCMQVRMLLDVLGQPNPTCFDQAPAIASVLPQLKLENDAVLMAAFDRLAQFAQQPATTATGRSPSPPHWLPQLHACIARNRQRHALSGWLKPIKPVLRKLALI
jgi:hypothetical protein